MPWFVSNFYGALCNTHKKIIPWLVLTKTTETLFQIKLRETTMFWGPSNIPEENTNHGLIHITLPALCYYTWVAKILQTIKSLIMAVNIVMCMLCKLFGTDVTYLVLCAQGERKHHRNWFY
jgi:hypothetical protein